MAKKCAGCGEKKPLRAFYTRTGRTDRQPRCIPCVSAASKARYIPETGEQKAERKDKRLRRVYGITLADYARMFEAQHGLCAICDKPPQPGKLPLNVDHDHKSGLIRGLICWYCNHKLLGVSRDDPELLRRAAAYLESPPSIAVIGRVIAPAKPKKRRKRTTTRRAS